MANHNRQGIIKLYQNTLQRSGSEYDCAEVKILLKWLCWGKMLVKMTVHQEYGCKSCDCTIWLTVKPRSGSEYDCYGLILLSFKMTLSLVNTMTILCKCEGT